MSGAVLRLVVVTFAWGVSFPCTSAWMAASKETGIDPLTAAVTLIALRMALAFIVLMLWQPGLRRASLAEHRAGVTIGLAFLLGFILQTWGLAMTTPALSAFFTNVSAAWVPLIMLCLGQRVSPLTLLGLSLGLVGCAVLVKGWSINPGDWLTLASSVVFAVQMILLDRFGKALRPAMLTPSFLLVNAVAAALLAVLFAALGPGVGVWLGQTATMLRDPALLGLVVVLAVFPTALGFHWMNEFQPKVDPSRAALIYLLEPVFTTLISLAVGQDQMTHPLFWGGVLILVGNAVVVLLERPRPEESLTQAAEAEECDRPALEGLGYVKKAP
jgi:drug/metabolite transporter (DMT)-like permease